VLAFGQHAFALGTVIALAERSRSNRRSRAARPDRRVRGPSRLVATATENRLSFPALKPALFQIENDDDRD
jgi:hypothetical protein